MWSKSPVLPRIATRIRRIRKFTSARTSWKAAPALAIAAIARDNPFGGVGAFNGVFGKAIGIIGVRTQASGGALAWIDTHDLGNLVSCEEVLIDAVYNLSLVPFEPAVVVDCGAHIGLFSLLAALRFPDASLIAFEPNPANFRMAQLQLARFGGRVKLIDAAVSTEDGESRFSAAASNTGQLCEDGPPTGVRVRMVDLSQSLERLGNRPLLLKMDVEGKEQELIPHVVRGLPSRCAIFFESHGGERAWSEQQSVLLSAGFHVTRLRERCLYNDSFAVRDA